MKSNSHNSTFSEHGHVAYQIKRNQKCINMVANFCTQTATSLPTPPPPPQLNVEIQIFQNMVMLHINFKWNHKCNNMVANIWSADPPPPPSTLGEGERGQNSTFLEHGHVAY